MPQWEHTNGQIWYWLYWFEENWIYKHFSYRSKRTYQNKICIDGSVLDSLDSGAGFVIPHLKVQKSFNLGKVFFHIHIWVICNINGRRLHMQCSASNFFIYICVDSESVLYALKNWNCKMRGEYILWSKVINTLYNVYGVWDGVLLVPSHCGLYWNEISNKLAKQGATKNRHIIQ